MKSLGVTSGSTIIVEMTPSEYRDYETWQKNQPTWETNEENWTGYFRDKLSSLNLNSRLHKNLARTASIQRIQWPKELASYGYPLTFDGWCDFVMTKRGEIDLMAINDIGTGYIIELYRAIWTKYRTEAKR